MSTQVTDCLTVDVHTVTYTTVTIAIVGRLDAARCPELRSEFDGRLATGCDELIVDLWDAEFVDSVGLAALVKAMRDAEGIGALFAIVRPASEDAMRVFRLSKFDEVFDMRTGTR